MSMGFRGRVVVGRCEPGGEKWAAPYKSSLEVGSFPSYFVGTLNKYSAATNHLPLLVKLQGTGAKLHTCLFARDQITGESN